VGVRRGGAAVVPGGGVPLHPAAAHVPGARPPRQGVPALAVAAARVLAAQVNHKLSPPPLRFAASVSVWAMAAMPIRNEFAVN